MKWILVLFTTLVLIGCARPMVDRITEFCAKNGYAPGTALYLDCFRTVARANAEHGTVRATNARTLGTTGLGLMQLGAPRTLGNAPTKSLTCIQQGAFTTCN